jgi:hypothetical protein
LDLSGRSSANGSSFDMVLVAAATFLAIAAIADWMSAVAPLLMEELTRVPPIPSPLSTG